VDLEWYAQRDGVWRELKLAAPARRALINANICTVDDLKQISETELVALHGIGKNALMILRPLLTSERDQ
jgi:hypothetical protein